MQVSSTTLAYSTQISNTKQTKTDVHSLPPLPEGNARPNLTKTREETVETQAGSSSEHSIQQLSLHANSKEESALLISDRLGGIHLWNTEPVN